MCLGVPGRVLAVNGQIAQVDFFGVRRETRLDIIDEPVGPGDYILNHVGFAIRRIPTHEIDETLALYELLLREAEHDMMAADVRGEIDATRAADAPGAAGD
jgi:hydrogenase expression/formation protein HypC